MNQIKAPLSVQDWLKGQGAIPALCHVLDHMADACVSISRTVRINALHAASAKASGVTNVQGETQLDLDVTCDAICREALGKSDHVALMVSEEVDSVIENAMVLKANNTPSYAVSFDPLDGSGNVATNAAIGTIFSVLDIASATGNNTQKVLGSTRNQVAAGYALYGPATLLMLTTGKSVAMFALNDQTNRFDLVREGITIATTANEFSINMSYEPLWSDGVYRYVRDCIAGKSGPRSKTYNMRWAGAMVADVHRVFMKGGHFIYPAMAGKGNENGKLRLLYEGIPMAMLIETAGGKAMAGTERLADIVPTSIHQRVPVSLGAEQEVSTLAALIAASG